MKKLPILNKTYLLPMFASINGGTLDVPVEVVSFTKPSEAGKYKFGKIYCRVRTTGIKTIGVDFKKLKEL